MSLKTWDAGSPPRVYIPNQLDSTLLSTSTIWNAKEYIINRANDEQIIIINEAHHNARHRTFTASLLKGLYEKGYRYLGLEALWDTTINTRAYAIQSSGYYTAEPEFGNMIHLARTLGYTVFGYEAGEDKNGKEREIEQAKNIKAFMDRNQNGKYLIHCGYDHVMEGEMRGWEKAMAGRLKEYTGIDPFTIDQVKFSEKSKNDFAHYFVYATDEQDAFVLKASDSSIFNGFRLPKQTDIVVIHPQSDLNNNRVSWLAKGKRKYRIPDEKLNKFTLPVQVLAYRTGEHETNGIPAYIIEITEKNKTQNLILGKGIYTIIVKDDHYQIVDQFNIEVME
jgi:hypothetical protein